MIDQAPLGSWPNTTSTTLPVQKKWLFHPSSSAKRWIVWTVLWLATLRIVFAYLRQAPWEAFWAYALVYFLIPLISSTPVAKRQTYIGIWWWLLATIVILLWGFESFAHWAGWLSILWILYSIDQHREIIQSKQKATSWHMAYLHSAAFCMSAAITVSLSLMWKWENFSLTCDQVRETINTHMATFMSPLRFTTAQISLVQEGINTFFTQSPEEIVQSQVQQHIESQLEQQIWATQISGINFSWLIDQQQYAALEKLLHTANTWPNTSKNIVQKNSQVDESFLWHYKSLLLDTPLDTKQNLDKKICNVVFDQISDWYKKPWFKISILLTLVLFFYPLMRFFIVIYSGILSLIYGGLKRIGVLKTQSETITKDSWIL